MTITTENVKSRNLYSFDDKSFCHDEVRSLGDEALEAIRKLSELALETKKGRELATRVDQKDELSTAVAFSEKMGLRVKLNDDEQEIATADEVYQGSVPGLEEIKKIHAALERKGLISFQDTEEKAKDAFQEVVDERNAKIGLTPLPGLVVESGCKKICRVAGEIIFFLAGIMSMKNAVDNMESALTFLSCTKFLEGLSTFTTAIFAVLKCVAKICHDFFLKVAAGAAFPITTLIFYGSVLVAAIYRLIVQVRFGHKLNAMVGERNDREKLKEALIWLRQQSQLSHLEVKENEKTGPLAAMRKKWENFTLRVEESVIDGAVDPEKLDGLIKNFNESNARNMIDKVLQGNNRAIFWSCGSILFNTIGIVATVAYLGAFGHITVGVIVALYLIASIMAPITDSPHIRVKLFSWLLEKFEPVKSENNTPVGSICKADSVHSYTPNVVLPKTPLKPTAETSPLSQAS